MGIVTGLAANIERRASIAVANVLLEAAAEAWVSSAATDDLVRVDGGMSEAHRAFVIEAERAFGRSGS